MLKNMNISSELFLKDVVPYLAECANKLNKFAPHKNLFANSFAVMRLHLLRNKRGGYYFFDKFCFNFSTCKCE